MQTTRRLSQGEIQRPMEVSDALARLTHERFHGSILPFDLGNAMPASALSPAARWPWRSGSSWGASEIARLCGFDLDFGNGGAGGVGATTRQYGGTARCRSGAGDRLHTEHTSGD